MGEQLLLLRCGRLARWGLLSPEDILNVVRCIRRCVTLPIVVDLDLLNNNMFGFNLFPGRTDTKGQLGTAPNTIAPGKRPISSMAPTIVTENGRVKLVTGSPGSQGIPHTLLCVMVNCFDFHMPLQAAVEVPRLSHQWFPDAITFEAPERYPELVKSLQALGHTVVRSGLRPQGAAHSILVEQPNRYLGVADLRRSRHASAAGY
ncbi:MAG: gamma-glutamyltransferase [Verrucomicrobia bacterium]|nr:gamma-glutamyltransferase [Verrucomicrobiota bacterium]